MIPALEDAVIDRLSRTLGDAIVGSDITRMFDACGITDTSGESTKWKRIYYTFAELQRLDKCANRLGQFVQSALAPARWSARRDEHAVVRDTVNHTLLFAGCRLLFVLL